MKAVLINPRLAGDASSVELPRMRDQFLGSDGGVRDSALLWCNGNIFKRFPGMWRLYLQDEERRGGSGRGESASRLAGDELDDVVMQELRPKGEDGEEVEAGPVEKVFGLVASLQRFANSLK